MAHENKFAKFAKTNFHCTGRTRFLSAAGLVPDRSIRFRLEKFYLFLGKKISRLAAQLWPVLCICLYLYPLRALFVY